MERDDVMGREDDQCARAELVISSVSSLRATRVFTAEPVPREALRRIVEAVRWTGSARNRQPWRFAVVLDADVRERLSGLGAYAQHLADAPAVIALLSNADLGGEDTLFDIGRACQNLALAADALGYGSCVATLHPGHNASTAARILGFDHPWRASHALSVGRPGPPPTGRSAIPTGRLAPDELVTWIEGPLQL